MLTLTEIIIQKFPFLLKHDFVFEDGANNAMWGKAGHLMLAFEIGTKGKFIVAVKVGNDWLDLSLFRNLIDGTKTPNFFKSDKETVAFLEKEFETVKTMMEAENLEATVKRFEELTGECIRR